MLDQVEAEVTRKEVPIKGQVLVNRLPLHQAEAEAEAAKEVEDTLAAADPFPLR